MANQVRSICEICADYDRNRIQEKREKPFKLLAQVVNESYGQTKTLTEIIQYLKENGYERFISV